MTGKRRFAIPTFHLGRVVAGGLLVFAVVAAALGPLKPERPNPGAGDPRVGAASSLAAFIVGESRHPADAVYNSTSASDEIDALAVIMRHWGVRHVAVCGPAVVPASANTRSNYTIVLRCAGSIDAIAADARAIAGTRSQAVIYSGTADDAAAFVTALRGQRSFAMVVLAPSVDRERVSALLPPDARRWVLAAGRRASDGSDGTQTLTVAMLGNSGRHAR